MHVFSIAFYNHARKLALKQLDPIPLNLVRVRANTAREA